LQKFILKKDITLNARYEYSTNRVTYIIDPSIKVKNGFMTQERATYFSSYKLQNIVLEDEDLTFAG
jgi:hypothetical protein